MFCFEVSDSLGLPCQTTHNLFPLGVATADHLPQSNPNTLFCLTNPLGEGIADSSLSAICIQWINR